ncbi:MAG TPA: MFS transporter [Microbacterium sp.]|uniref:MFS transporter n=1 Tax=Microbacterium sp. TaxID=51671 RepID=UPI002D1C4C9F|nr:MFS transporter [Microbacterium sp.]HWI32503.1 MFS transporter [Microbacterium sp.]
MTTTTPTPRTLAEFTDSVGLTWRQWLYFSLITLVLLTDGMDVTIVSHIFPSLVREWGVSIGGGIALVVSGGFVAMGLGALVAGRLSDIWGRRIVIIGATSTFAVGTALGATSGDFSAFVAWRLLACLGMGAAMASGSTLLADLVPAKRRSAMLAAAYAGVGLGTTVGAVLAGFLIPTSGWRTLLFVAGIIPLAVIVVVAFVVPESPAFYAARGAVDKAQRVLRRLAPAEKLVNIELVPPVKRNAREELGMILRKPFAISTVLLWLFGFFSLGVQLLIAQYLPTLLQLPAPGMDTVQSSTIVGLYGLAGVVGSLLLGAVLVRVSRFLIIGILLVVSAGMVLVIGFFPNPTFGALLMIFALAGLILPATMGPTRSVLAAAAYPTRIRGAGVGTTEFGARVGSAFGGAAGGMLIGAGLGLSGLFLTILIPIGVLLVTLGGLKVQARLTGADSRAGYKEELAPVVTTHVPVAENAQSAG